MTPLSPKPFRLEEIQSMGEKEVIQVITNHFCKRNECARLPHLTTYNSWEMYSLKGTVAE